MLTNCEYNRVKMIKCMSKVAWFLKEYCHKDAQSCGGSCRGSVEELKKQLDSVIDELRDGKC